MGIVPENEHLPGLEGAGVIRRVGSLVSSLNVGQRVLVYEKGTFANRIQVTPERVYPLPASMSFEVSSCRIVSCGFIPNPEPRMRLPCQVFISSQYMVSSARQIFKSIR
jgi:NADPH:quinone reductase-like Zn-dependent oxidoreductase